MFIVAAIGHRSTPPPSGPPDVVATFINNYQSGVDGTSFTFPVSTGTAAADRRLLIEIVNRQSGAGSTVSSVKVHVPDVASDPTGIAASSRATVQGSSNRISHFIASVPSGTAAEIVVSYGALTQIRCGIAVTALYNLQSDALANAAVSDTTSVSSVLSVATDVPAGGVAIGTAYAAAVATWVWSGITERYDALIEANNQRSGASSVFVTAQTALAITATQSSGDGTGPLLLVTTYR